MPKDLYYSLSFGRTGAGIIPQTLLVWEALAANYQPNVTNFTFLLSKNSKLLNHAYFNSVKYFMAFNFVS